MENVGDIVAAERVVPEDAKARKGWGTIELVFRQPQNIFVIVLANRTRVIGEHIETLLESALESNLKSVVVSCSISSQVISVLPKIGKWKIRCLGSPRGKNQVWNVSLLPVEQVVSIVSDVGDGNRLGLGQLILNRSIPLLRISCFPGPLESNQSQTVRTEVRA